MDVNVVSSLASGTGKGKGSSSPRGGCFKCGGNHFQRECTIRVTPLECMYKKATKVRELENPMENPKVPRMPAVRTKGLDFGNLFSDSHPDNSWFDYGWSCDEWNDDWSSVGWHAGWEEPYVNSEGSFSLGSVDLGAVSSP